MTKGLAKKYMLRLGFAVKNAFVKTVIDIKRLPRIHSLIIIALPPTISYVCEDDSKTCELFMYNLHEELESMGLTPLFSQNSNKYTVEVYEKIKL